MDATLCGQGPGAGNCPIEAFTAVAELYGWHIAATCSSCRMPSRHWCVRSSAVPFASIGQP